MLLTITCEAENALDLGYLLHKNPASIFEASFWFGKATVFYPEAEERRCTAAMLLDVDPIGLVRGPSRGAALGQYVNDRPYVASSLMSVALAEAFGTALNGRSRERPQRVAEKLPLRAHLAAVGCGGGSDLIARLFTPLGYSVTFHRAAPDARVPEEGAPPILGVTLEGRQTVQDLLSHLYVLIPVLDNAKHYFIGEDEVDKLLRRGERWLPGHPDRDLIVRRYLAYRGAMVRDALARLPVLQEEAPETVEEEDARHEAQEAAAETPLRLNALRLEAAVEAVRDCPGGARRVIDLGCGEGTLLKHLASERNLREIVGVDVSAHALALATRRLHLDTASDAQRERLRLLQGSLTYRDDRFSGYDVALLTEVIEHVDPARLPVLEQVVFGHARPRRGVVTTPNIEYNVKWPSLPAGRLRHRDHRFEWTRAEFGAWAAGVGEREGYTVSLSSIGPEDDSVGSPTQMAIFDRS